MYRILFIKFVDTDWLIFVCPLRACQVINQESYVYSWNFGKIYLIFWNFEILPWTREISVNLSQISLLNMRLLVQISWDII